jgi:hypothetical protein
MIAIGLCEKEGGQHGFRRTGGDDAAGIKQHGTVDKQRAEGQIMTDHDHRAAIGREGSGEVGRSRVARSAGGRGFPH